MAKLRHLGIRTEDTGKLTSFYVDVFDMKVIHKSKEEGGTIFPLGRLFQCEQIL
jgi:catechol 2,3-dioxygenase-like lactoylglutathione lyase family enzyme